VDWHQADLSKLFERIRERFPASEAERMVWAFERARLTTPSLVG
jgi:hypothetical protein